MEAEQSYLEKKREMEEAAERRAAEAEARAVKEAEERELEMERLREQMARDRDEENRQTEADRNRELQEQLKVKYIFSIISNYDVIKAVIIHCRRLKWIVFYFYDVIN